MSEQANSDFKVADAAAAQAAVARFLIPSFVCDIGFFGGLATMRFCNDAHPEEIWLSVDCALAIDPTPVLPSGLTSRQEELLLLESLYGAEVSTVECRPDGSLRLALSEDKVLRLCPRDEQADPELWTMQMGVGALVVAMRGGGYAIFAEPLTK